MQYLAELESVLLSGELERSADEDEDTAGGARGLAVDGRDVVEALLERQARQLLDDRLRSLDLGAFEGQHRVVLVQIAEGSSVRVEGAVVVLDEGLGNGIGIH